MSQQTNIKLLQNESIEELNKKYNYSSLANLGQRFGEKGEGVNLINITIKDIYNSICSSSNKSLFDFNNQEDKIICRLEKTNNSYYIKLYKDNMIVENSTITLNYTTNYNSDFENIKINFIEDGVLNITFKKDEIDCDIYYDDNKNCVYGKYLGYIIESGKTINEEESLTTYEDSSFYLLYDVIYRKLNLNINNDNIVGWTYSINNSSISEIDEILGGYNELYNEIIVSLINRYNINYTNNIYRNFLIKLYDTINDNKISFGDGLELNSNNEIYIPLNYNFQFMVNVEGEYSGLIEYLGNDITLEYRCEEIESPLQENSKEYISIFTNDISISRFVKISGYINRTLLSNVEFLEYQSKISYFEPYIGNDENWYINNINSKIIATGKDGGQPNFIVIETTYKNGQIGCNELVCPQRVKDSIGGGKLKVMELNKQINLPYKYNDINNVKPFVFCVPNLEEYNKENENDQDLISSLIVVSISKYYKEEKIKSIDDIDEDNISKFEFQSVICTYKKTIDENNKEVWDWEYCDKDFQQTKNIIEYINNTFDGKLDDKIEGHNFETLNFAQKSFGTKNDNEVYIKPSFGISQDSNNNLVYKFKYTTNNNEIKFLNYGSGKYLDFFTNELKCYVDNNKTLLDTSTPTLDFSDVLINNQTIVDRINLMVLGYDNNKNVTPYYGYFGSNPQQNIKEDEDIIFSIGTYTKNPSLGESLSSKDFREKQGQGTILDICFNKLRNINTSELKTIISETISTQSLESETISTQSLESETISTQSLESETISTQSLESETSNLENINSKNVNIEEELNVNGQANFNENTNIKKNLDVYGNVNIQQSLNVNKISSFQEESNFLKDVNINGVLHSNFIEGGWSKEVVDNMGIFTKNINPIGKVGFKENVELFYNTKNENNDNITKLNTKLFVDNYIPKELKPTNGYNGFVSKPEESIILNDYLSNTHSCKFNINNDTYYSYNTLTVTIIVFNSNYYMSINDIGAESLIELNNKVNKLNDELINLTNIVKESLANIVILNTNGGEIKDEYIIYKKNEFNLNSIFNSSLYIPSKPGCDFLGWYLDENFTKKISTLTFTGVIKVYAKWRETNYSTIKISNNSKSIESQYVPSQIVTYNLSMDSLEENVPKGYKFKGYVLDEINSNVNIVGETKTYVELTPKYNDGEEQVDIFINKTIELDSLINTISDGQLNFTLKKVYTQSVEENYEFNETTHQFTSYIIGVFTFVVTQKETNEYISSQTELVINVKLNESTSTTTTSTTTTTTSTTTTSTTTLLPYETVTTTKNPTILDPADPRNPIENSGDYE